MSHLAGVGRVALCVLAVAALAACATRPGPEALTPVAAQSGANSVQIYVATTRERESPTGNIFTSNRAKTLNFAKFSVSIPNSHKPGNIEMPTVPPDPENSFAIVDQAVLSEAAFRAAVAPSKTAGAKKRKAFVFVHGFNNNFQESLFRITQLQADAKIDGIPILFSWPSLGQVAAYEADKDAARYSRDHLIALLTMLSSSPGVSDILLVAHSMGGMLTMEALQELRTKSKGQVIARLGRVVLAAPDINAQTFRAQVQTVGALNPPLLILVTKDDAALRVSSMLSGAVPRAGAVDVDNPIVQEAALKAKVQIVDISQLASHDSLHHDQFVSVAVLYSSLQHQVAPYRNRAGTYVLAGDSGALKPVDVGAQAINQ